MEDAEQSAEYYYPEELVEGSRDWQNVSHKPGESANCRETISAKDSELQTYIDEQANPNTKRKTNSDMKVWDRYCQQRGEARKMEAIPAEELDLLLGYFFKDITKKDSLMNLTH